jgi:hypothetical protein
MAPPAEAGDSPHLPGGRHTLGSSPETQEPAGRVVLPALPEAGGDGAPAEPLRTIHVESWKDARERTLRLDPPVRALFSRLLDQVETGWEPVATLQRLYEEQREHARTVADDYAHLLNFIDGDLVDLFRELAAAVAALVPGYDGWEAEADPGGVEGELDRFERYFVVFRHAVEDIGLPPELRDAVRAAVQGLAGWSTELAVHVAAIDEAVIAPLYHRGRDSG